MSRHAEPVPAPSTRKKAAPAAATRPKPRPPSHPRRAATAQPIQRRQAPAAGPAAPRAEPAAEAPNHAGLPEGLKAGVERLSGLAMDDVRVHRDSAEPGRLGALAYTKGSDIHLGPGQERHLPHEAWHVVQQKQGRVATTMQMKGVALNADIGLETEADRMGEAAARRAGPAAPGRLRSASAGPGVAQRKIIHKKVELELCPKADPCCHSEIVEAHIADEKEYVMKDTSQVIDNEIHLLEKKYYVFGERHDADADRRWNEDVQGWTSVDKMVEDDLSTPGRPSLGQPLYHGVPIVLGTLSYDSIAANFLIGLLIVHNSLTRICDASDKKLEEAGPRLAKPFSFVLGWFKKEYVDWLPRIPDDPAISADPDKVASAAALVEKYTPELDKLRVAFRRLAVKVDVEDPDGATAALPDSADQYRDDLEEKRGFVPDLVRDLGVLLSASRKEAKAIDRRLSAKGPNATKAIDATLDIRDRVMISNLGSATPPVLVKTGGWHAGILADKFGKAVISLPPDMPLAKLTKRDKVPKSSKPPGADEKRKQ